MLQNFKQAYRLTVPLLRALSSAYKVGDSPRYYIPDNGPDAYTEHLLKHVVEDGRMQICGESGALPRLDIGIYFDADFLIEQNCRHQRG